MKDPNFFKDKEGRGNVEKAKEILSEFVPLPDQIIDDSFFKFYMRDFEPVTATEVA